MYSYGLQCFIFCWITLHHSFVVRINEEKQEPNLYMWCKSGPKKFFLNVVFQIKAAYVFRKFT